MSYCQVCGGVCVASVPSGQRASVESELAELQRYRDRAPIEHELREAANEALYQWSCKALSGPAISRLSKAVSESFKASLAAAAAADESA